MLAVKERMMEIQSELSIRTQAYQYPLDKEDRFWERLINLKLSSNTLGPEKNKKLAEAMQGIFPKLKHFKWMNKKFV